MTFFTLYHVVGIKVGCSKEYDARCLQNRMTYGFDVEIVILEEFFGDEKGATLREEYWAKSFGYKVGNGYRNAIEARRIAGKNSVQSPHHASQREECRQAFLAAGTKASNVPLTCPHCGKTGQATAMFRWHFARCRKKA